MFRSLLPQANEEDSSTTTMTSRRSGSHLFYKMDRFPHAYTHDHILYPFFTEILDTDSEEDED